MCNADRNCGSKLTLHDCECFAFLIHCERVVAAQILVAPMPLSNESTPPLIPAHRQDGSAARAQPVAVKSEILFGGSPEVLIDHRGVMYRLRQTSLGKLILTK